jgi:transcriptional regulator NrdR family protein
MICPNCAHRLTVTDTRPQVPGLQVKYYACSNCHCRYKGNEEIVQRLKKNKDVPPSKRNR